MINSMSFMLLFTFYLYLTPVCSEKNVPIVKTQLGTVVGHYKKSYDGKLYSAFEGIPYAKPPTGNLRFAEPQPIEPWLGNWIATKVHTCIQLYPTGIVGDEDCLYINVYVPNSKPSSEDNYDVVVHIHGGGFEASDPNLAGPRFLMDRDIVYVNFNYRLGVLGFLSTGDDIVKGNMGLKDQVLALQWIQNNIREFGGNSSSVTLTGFSAGASSVHLHYLSHKSKGLFHRGVSHSGTATAPFVLQKNPLRNAKLFASVMGCKLEAIEDILECLRQRPARDFIIANKHLIIKVGVSATKFSPVVEKRTVTAFLSDNPFQLLHQGKVSDLPWIVSMTTEEGVLGVLTFMEEFKYIDEHWNETAPLVLTYYDSVTCPPSSLNDVSETIRKYYFKNESLSNSIPTFIKLFTDRYFALDLEKSACIQAKVTKSPVYSYIYGYKEESINAEKVLGLNEYYGVSHGSDSHNLYNMQDSGFNLTAENLTKSDESIKNFLVDMVVTFAKTGRPANHDVWHPVNSTEDFGYLFIKDPKNMVMTYKNELAPTKFWQSLKLKEDESYECNDL